ncbi:hypothetical protein G7Y29_09765 [Corynebacterium qintianiae]|uniref:Uncharacterized protein n=1 Tax=Corynebacterium qintianiae TaxID=2709392 RepID=A0A7T0KM98_9CORY|nr:hypothetical protein [Corynebacterium qintianiae]QPK83107.1 hypothetical protein G7Y29_09765 [Corynebacterium qintianiae]
MTPMSIDMSAFLPAGLPDDWVPAQLDNIDATTLTFSTAVETAVREFASAQAAFSLTALIAPGFDYSPSRNAARLKGGEVVVLPQPGVERTRVSAAECTLICSGHRPHWIPALRAGNGPASDWLPVDAVAVEGNRVTFQTPTETIVVYNHEPLRCATAVDYNPRWGILRGPDSDGRRAVFTYSRTPITPCTA